MRPIRFAAIVLCSLGMFAFSSAPAVAKPEFAGREKTTCPTCHVMTDFPKKKNDVGECYKRNGYKDLASCQKDPKK
ncbi:MAG: hypothetical protein A2762_02800 [Candidatus Lloydbacteria bacterium RIFCSPHIGHO2_01_FULL_54_11]|nr:MAG: hypothetical protein A2762_02800 [Candidatus Lloydbacteria bacterium RIFCSPHIGHO2_01_FULL_54_11]OGZ16390.1 MAG: hypothetical protein A3H76_03345 [Candidatus Lloydbacteria bacterium RIFCSPLOWO2_02_FULL_54_12]